MVAGGLGIVLSPGLVATIGGSGPPLSADFSAAPARAAQGIMSILLMRLFLAHVSGRACHALLLKDRRLSRMWFGKRGSGTARGSARLQGVPLRLPAPAQAAGAPMSATEWSVTHWLVFHYSSDVNLFHIFP